MAEPPRHRRPPTKLSRFALGNSTSIRPIETNPLVTLNPQHVPSHHLVRAPGVTEPASRKRGGAAASASAHDDGANAAGALSSLTLPDLLDAKVAFEKATRGGARASPDDRDLTSTEMRMDMAQFIRAFAPRHVSAKTKARNIAELGSLFMRVDCDSDGVVTWTEFLSYAASSLGGSGSAAGAASGGGGGGDGAGSSVSASGSHAPHWSHENEPKAKEAHREISTHILYVAGSVLTAAGDGTLKVWSRDRLALERTIPINAERNMTTARLVYAAPSLAKLIVVDTEDVLTMYAPPPTHPPLARAALDHTLAHASLSLSLSLSLSTRLHPFVAS